MNLAAEYHNFNRKYTISEAIKLARLSPHYHEYNAAYERENKREWGYNGVKYTAGVKIPLVTGERHYVYGKNGKRVMHETLSGCMLSFHVAFDDSSGWDLWDMRITNDKHGACHTLARRWRLK